MSARKQTGVMIPIATPLSQSDAPDTEGVRVMAEFLLSQRADALFANGSMGGFAFFPDDDQMETIRAVVQTVAGRVPVLAGASDTGLNRVLRKVEVLNDLSLAAIVVLPPYYYSHSQDEIRKFFESIAGASRHPVMLYENPRLAKNSLSVETIAALARHPNICGVKLSSADTAMWRALVEHDLPRERFSLICGAGRSTDQALQLGFDGITEGLHNIVPHLARALMDVAVHGNWKRAGEIQREINEAFRIFDLAGGWLGLELAFEAMGMPMRFAAAPMRRELPEATRTEVLGVINKVLIPAKAVAK